MNKQIIKKTITNLFAAAIFLLTAIFADAATLTVTNTNDSGAGSLRQAVTDSNASAANDTINFNITGCPNNVCTIVLTSGELAINDASTAGSLTITNAGGTTSIAISGNNQSRVFFVNPSGNLTLNNLTVTGGNGTGTDPTLNNFGGGIISNGGTVTITNSTVTNNTVASNGGGIYSTGGNNATFVITNSTITNNTAGNIGGGIRNNGTTTITNSTISSNSANGNAGGGGISNSTGITTVINSTISGNTANGTSGGGGIRSTTGTVNLKNTIVAANVGPSTAPDIAGAITSQGYNLIGNNSGGTITATTGDQIGTTASPINPRLAPFGNYGGTTRTFALLSGSPAINAGTATGAPTTDQRGAARVGQVDIGAFELNNTTNGGTYRAALSGSVNTPFNYQLTPNSGAFTYSVTSGALPPGLSLNNALIAAGPYSIQGTPTQGGTFNFTVTATDGTNTNTTDYTITVTGAPTAAGVSIGGRVRTADGRGITNITVTVYGGNLRQPRTVTTSSFGYYRFADLAAGQTYILEVRGKRYSFRQPTHVVSLVDNALGEDFIAEQ